MSGSDTHIGIDPAGRPDETGIILLCRDSSRIDELRALAREIESGAVCVAGGKGDRTVRCLALLDSGGTPEERAEAVVEMVREDPRLAGGQHQVLVVDDHVLERRAVEILGRRMRDELVLACPPRDQSCDLRVERMRPERPWENNKLRRMGRPRRAKGRK